MQLYIKRGGSSAVLPLSVDLCFLLNVNYMIVQIVRKGLIDFCSQCVHIGV